MQFSILLYKYRMMETGGFPLGILMYDPQTDFRDFSLLSPLIEDYEHPFSPIFLYPSIRDVELAFKLSQKDLKTFTINFKSNRYAFSPIIEINKKGG